MSQIWSLGSFFYPLDNEGQVLSWTASLYQLVSDLMQGSAPPQMLPEGADTTYHLLQPKSH